MRGSEGSPSHLLSPTCVGEGGASTPKGAGPQGRRLQPPSAAGCVEGLCFKGRRKVQRGRIALRAMNFIGRLRRRNDRMEFHFDLLPDGSVPLAIPPRHCVALSRPGGKRVTGFSVVYRLPANPVPLPPDKQGGAREYIGARHPPLKQWWAGTLRSLLLCQQCCMR